MNFPFSSTLKEKKERIFRLQKNKHAIFLCIFMMFSIWSISFMVASNPPTVDFSTATYLSQTNWDGGVGTNTSSQYSSQTSIGTATSGQITVSSSLTAATWYDSAWTYRKQVSINPSQVSSTQTNFPVLLTGANFDAAFFSLVSSTGQDIIFTDSDGTTLLPREIVSVSTTAETLEAWVRIPSVSALSTTTFYVYYGNASSTISNSSTVWSNYSAVWHLNEDPSVTTDGDCGGGSFHMCDSGLNSNHGTSTNMVSGSSVNAQIGQGLQFNQASSQQVNFGNDPSIGNLGSFSMSTWIRYDGIPQSDSSGRIVHKQYGSCTGGWMFGFDDDGAIYNSLTYSNDSVSPSFLFDVDSSGQGHYNYMQGGNLSADTWHHVSVLWDAGFTNSSARYFVDGTEVALGHVRGGSGTSADDTLCPFFVGSNNLASRRLDAMLDEMHFSGNLFSSSYVVTEYNNQSAPTSFSTVGAQESQTTSTLVSAIFDASTSAQAWGTVRWTTNNASNTIVKVRSSNDSGMSGATAFDSCNTVSQDQDISTNNCVTDGHRYMQYQVELTTSTAVFQDITIQSLQANTVTIAEDGGSVTVVASIDEASSSTISVPFTLSGTATQNSDYTIPVSAITIAAGQLSGTTTITITDDLSAESDETIILTMGTPTNGQQGALTTYTVTISDDETPVYVSLSSDVNAISENGGVATLTATLDRTALQTVTVNLATSSVATEGVDYTLASSQLSIAAGQTTATTTITGISDTSIEGVENIIIDVSTVTNATETSTQQVAVSLLEYRGPLQVTSYHTSFDKNDPSVVGQYDVFEISLEHPVDYGGMANVTDVTVTTTFTNSNGGTQVISGFYFGTVTSSLTGTSSSIWKVRFASSTVGDWTYTYQFGRNSTGQETVGAGSFSIITSTRDGFARQHATNSYLWETENTGEYFQVHGFGDCLYRGQDVFKMDGGDGDGPFREEGTDYGHWADIYREIGYNTFRLQFQNCSQNLADENGDNFNFEVGQYFDHVIDRMHRDGFHILFGIWGFTHDGGGNGLGVQPSASLSTVQAYYDYVVARYGAYVDWWELENELQHNLASEVNFVTTSLNYIRSIDPYNHPMNTNYYYDDRAAASISELAEVEFLTPHLFSDPTYDQMYDIIATNVANYKGIDASGKPIFFGELGNTTANWVPDSVRVERTRSMLYLLNEVGVLQWNHSNGTATMAGAAANYLGLAERKSMSFVHWFFDLVTQYDTTVATTTQSNSSQFGIAAVTSTESVGIYAISKTGSALSGQTVTLDMPFAGTGYWIRPESGELISTTTFSTGSQVLTIPDFDVDIALYGTASTSLDTEPLAMVDITNVQDDGDMDNDSDTDYGPDSQEYGVSSTPFGVAPLTLVFNAASSTDVDGGSLTYLWDFGDGNTTTTMNPTYTYTTKGKYIAKLTVTDDEGNSSFMTFVVRVEADVNPGTNDAPYLNPPYATNITVREGDYLRITNYNRGDPEQASAGASYTFSAVSSGVNVVRGLLNTISGLPAGATFSTTTGAEDVVDFSWVPGFDQAGTYNITMTITDDGGLTDSQSYTIAVLEAGDMEVQITTSSLALSEAGVLTNIAVSLASQPTSTVTVSLTNSDSQLTLSSSTLRFTSSSWDTPAIVTVQATDDDTYEGSHTGIISYSVSHGGAFNNLSVTSTAFTITDNDVAGMTLTTSSLALSESGTTATYTVALTTAPTSTVTVSISISTDADVSVSPSSLTFTSSSYSTAQTVTVTAVDDAIVEGSHSGVVSHTVSQTNGGYDGYSLSSVTFTITDDDTASTPVVEANRAIIPIVPIARVIPIKNSTPDVGPSTSSGSDDGSSGGGAGGCDLDTGKAYKSTASRAVYYLTSDCKKRAFTQPQVFFTWFESWDEVETVDEEKLDPIKEDTLGFMPWGRLYDPKYGALVKTVNDPKVYLLLGGKKYWIISESVFTDLNYSWNWIEDIDQSLLDEYEDGIEITRTDLHPPFTLIKYADSPKVYRIEPHPFRDGLVKRHIRNEKVFLELGYRFDRIVTIDDDEAYADGEEL